MNQPGSEQSSLKWLILLDKLTRFNRRLLRGAEAPLATTSSMICYNEIEKPHGKTIIPQLSDKSGPAHAVAGKTVQADAQPLAAPRLATKLLWS